MLKLACPKGLESRFRRQRVDCRGVDFGSVGAGDSRAARYLISRYFPVRCLGVCAGSKGGAGAQLVVFELQDSRKLGHEGIPSYAIKSHGGSKRDRRGMRKALPDVRAARRSVPKKARRSWVLGVLEDSGGPWKGLISSGCDGDKFPAG